MTIRRSQAILSRTFCAGIAAVIGLVVAPAQQAQAQEGGDVLGNVLEEVVVTARKREESLKDVPVSISVISADFINESGIRDQYDLFQLTPGINYGEERDRNGARPGVRGVQAQNQNPLRQKVSVFIDGMPVLGNIGSMQFAGLERVEVLRGPQSTAFGRATFGGALNYVTADPGDTFNSEVYLGTSDQGRNQLHVGLDGPITDELGYMFNIYTDDYEGADEWFSSDGVRLGTRATDFITGKLKWAPTNNFDMEVTYYSLETDDGPPVEPYLSEAARDACMTYTLPNGRPYINGDFNCDMSSATPAGGIPLNHRPDAIIDQNADPLLHTWALANSVLNPGAFVERDRVQAEFNFSTDGGSTLQVLTSYQEETSQRWFDNDRTALPAEIAVVTMMGMTAASLINVATMAGPRINEEKFVDIRWLSPSDQPVRWLVGASWFDYQSLSSSHNARAGFLLGLEDEFQALWEADPRTSGQVFPVDNPWGFRSRDNEFTTNIGIYGSVQWDISDTTTLSAEVRRQEDDNTSLAGTDKFNNVAESTQPRLAITHALNDNWSTYAQYSTGTNPAGVNLPFTDQTLIDSLNAANAAGFVTYDASTYFSFREEEVTNFEVGIKGGALNNRLQLAAALYTMGWDDIITGANFGWNGDWNDGSFDPLGRIHTVTGSGMVFINGGTATLLGLELEGSYRINDNWNIRGGLTLADNTYDEFCDAATAIDDFGFAPTHTVANDGVLFDCVQLGGSKVTLGPENTLALSATYTAPLGGNGWEWSARGGLRWESEIYMDPVNLMEIPAVSEFSGSVSFSNDNWEITLFGNNLTDEDMPRSTINLDDDPNICGTSQGCTEDNFRLRLRTPREIGARLRYRF
jgi:iron complex outermembrane recepter protein